MPDPRIQDGIELARKGQYDEAETLFRAVLADAAGTRSETESRAYLNLGTLYGIVGRCMEALLLYRRGLMIARAQEHALAAVIHLANIGGIYVQLGLHERLQGNVAAIDTFLDTLRGPAREQADRHAAWQRYELAAWSGDTQAARLALQRIRELFGQDDDPRVRTAVHEIEATEHRDRGEIEGAEAVLTKALAEEDLTPTTRLALLCQEAALLSHAKRNDEAVEVASAALEELDATRDSEALNEESISVGTALAKVLADCEAHEKAQRAYDLIASAMIRRMGQLEASVDDLPNPGILDAEERAWLNDLRQEFWQQQDEVRKRVLQLLEDARRRGESPVHAPDGADDLVRVCAWCGLVRSKPGRWVPLRRYLPEDRCLRVTHTICETCGQDVAKAATAPKASDDRSFPTSPNESSRSGS